MNPRALLLFVLLSSGPLLCAGDKHHGGGAVLVHKCVHCTSPLELEKQKPLGGVKVNGAALERYPLFPQAGIIGQDLFVGNYVDLDPGGGILDVHCGGRSYNGHRGIDTCPVTFKYQDAGMPIFAVLDGVVTAARDGQPDRNTVWANQTSNFVRIDHGNSHITSYLHLKRDSVAVTVGQQVTAGQQLGLVGSSGVSTGPHLHFETTFQNQVVEPFTGACRGTESLWMQQPVEPTTPLVREFTLTAQDLSTWPGPPSGSIVNNGTFELGTRSFSFWINLLYMTPNMTWTYRLVDPNGAVIDQAADSFSGNYRFSWWWWGRTVEFVTMGTHHIELLFDDELVVRAPLEVVAVGAPRPNRAPYDAAFSFPPEGVSTRSVALCRRTAFEVIDDPDYDIVRTRFVWRVNGVVRREVTHAAMTDAFPRGRLSVGDVLTCQVTPTDDLADAASQTLTTTVFERYADWAARHGLAALSFDDDPDGDTVRNGFEYTLGLDPMVVDALPAHHVANSAILWQIPRSPTADPSLLLVMEFSTDMANWQSVPEQRVGNLSRFQAPFAAIRQFARLRVTHSSGQSSTVPVSAILP